MVARRLRSLLHSDTHRSEIAGNGTIMLPYILQAFITFKYLTSILNFLDEFNNFIKCNLDIKPNEMRDYKIYAIFLSVSVICVMLKHY